MVAEAKAGNSDAAAKRLEWFRKISELKTIGSVNRLAAALIAKGALPNKAIQQTGWHLVATKGTVCNGGFVSQGAGLPTDVTPPSPPIGPFVE